jgi:hypothetical protein
MYFFLFIFACIFGSQAEPPVRGVDPLLNTYSDYEDSIYGKSFKFLAHDLYRPLFCVSIFYSFYRAYMEFSWTMDLCIFVLWWKGKKTRIYFCLHVWEKENTIIPPQINWSKYALLLSS